MYKNHKRDFYFLWAGQSLNVLGDQILMVALPLFALSIPGVLESEAALLRFAFFLPFLLFSLFAGVIVDRLPLKRVMLVCDSIQASTFLLIVVLAWFKLLSLMLLLGLVFVSGCVLVFFQIAYSSYLPELFSNHNEIQNGNARLFFSESTARALGPLLAGPLIAFLGIMLTIFMNCLTFVISVLTLFAIRQKSESPRKLNQSNQPFFRDIKEGLLFILRHDKLEPVITCGGLYVLFLSMVTSCLVIYCDRVLNLSPMMIGIVVGSAAIGLPFGNLLAPKIAKKYGSSQTLVLGALISVSGIFGIPMSGALHSPIFLIITGIVHGVGEGLFGPTSLTLRQLETPKQLLGRINSVQRWLLWGMIAVGSLLASLLIYLWGISSALWIGGTGSMLCLIPLVRRGILQDILRQEKYKFSESEEVRT
ncbi:MFS transporter [Facilibium subflavum]|uniref:MFS transporter n=1 Tax=Facilibium subflavum TaxID=2219058 RepID=UPI0013C2DF33|nr:MFS transporter [Facilibium subflavum]